MADTAYERYKKDTRKDNLTDYTDFQKAMLNALDQMSAPKKPVKWTMGFGFKGSPYKGDVGALTLATALSPTLRAQSWFQEFKNKEGKVIKPKYVNLNKWIREYSGQNEKDYISGLDELAKGVETGQWQLSGAVSQLITIPTDFVLGTDYTNALEKKMNDEKIKPDDPETWRGELTSLGVQFGIPYATTLKLINRANALAPIYRLLGINKATKQSKIYRRAVEGATALGATDFIASSPGRPILNPWMQPESSEGLTGRKKAAVEFKNKLKYGFEGTLIGGGFPLMGKGLQLGYKYLGPKWALKTGARLGLRGANRAVFEPAAYIFTTPRFSPAHALPKKLAKKRPGLEKSLGKYTLYNPINPSWQWTSKAIRGMTNWTLTKAIAPTIASGLSGVAKDPVTGKRVWKWVGQLPPFERWRLGSVTSRDITKRSAKTLDNFLSWFRSYGKHPVSIEGAGEEAMLYGRSVARKFDRAFAGLEKATYNLAKGFEGQYNKATTSPAMQKYWLDIVDDYVMNQKSLKELPKELQGISKQVKETLEEVVTRFKNALPKGKQADEYANAFRDIL